MKGRKCKPLLQVLLIYVISSLLTVLIVWYLNVNDEVVRVFIADIILTLFVFGFSFITKNSSVYDPYWSVIPLLIVAYLFYQHPDGNTLRQVVIMVLVLFWSVRLTANWARGWDGFHQQDWRYTNLALKTGKYYWAVSFLGIHLMPTLLVFLGCLPMFYLMSDTEPLHLYEIVAVVVCLLSVSIEWIADEQLLLFKNKESHKAYLDSGLWKVVRHPNYLGEILFWFGLFLFIPTSGNADHLLLLASGFVSMILLFSFISVPMMKKRNLRNKEGYVDYIAKVPALFPYKFNLFTKKH